MGKTKDDRIGECFKTKEGYEIIIIEYNRNDDLWIEFQDEHKAIKNVEYRSCVNGQVKNPYHPSVFGIGYLGVGKYEPTINNKKTKQYDYWYNMMSRCYNDKEIMKRPTYEQCFVNEEVHCFQDFCKWFDNNYYEVEEDKMCLDKDILVKDNKEYRFDRMIFVPQRINTLFIKSDSIRGGLPIGVYYHKATNKYVAQCSILTDKGQKRKHLGLYNTPEEAFEVYKQFKEAYIKEVADEYKDKIPQRLYDAMYNWIVEIDD